MPMRRRPFLLDSTQQIIQKNHDHDETVLFDQDEIIYRKTRLRKTRKVQEKQASPSVPLPLPPAPLPEIPSPPLPPPPIQVPDTVRPETPLPETPLPPPPYSPMKEKKKQYLHWIWAFMVCVALLAIVICWIVWDGYYSYREPYFPMHRRLD